MAMRPRHCTDANVLCFLNKTMYCRQVCNLLCQAVHPVVEQANIVACKDLPASMQLAPYHYRDTHRRLNGWVKGKMAETLTLMSQYRTSVPALVSPARTSQGF